MSDQQQAQVPVAVEGASEPHEELANSTSGAAYELETSGDGEARQMAVSNDDTADLFGSPLPLNIDGLQVSQATSSGSELSEQVGDDLRSYSKTTNARVGHAKPENPSDQHARHISS